VKGSRPDLSRFFGGQPLARRRVRSDKALLLGPRQPMAKPNREPVSARPLRGLVRPPGRVRDAVAEVGMMGIPSMAVDLISIPEAARRVGLHPDTLYRLCRSGRFPPAIQIGSRFSAAAGALSPHRGWRVVNVLCSDATAPRECRQAREGERSAYWLPRTRPRTPAARRSRSGRAWA
jgi:predicted DNA-binding transcriptional regulator AlpA